MASKDGTAPASASAHVAATEPPRPTAIPPALWARIRGLALPARVRPQGLGQGAHAGHGRGTGLEFEQYRAYEPGDEPRRIDWKLFARTDRYVVREATRATPLTVWLLIDATASMRQADAARPAWRKFDAARLLAACIGELALQQGDGFGFVALTDAASGGWRGIASGTGAAHRGRFRLALDGLRCSGRFPEVASLASLWSQLLPDTLVVVLSDGFDDALVALAERLAGARRQVALLQLLSAEERDFPFDGARRFVDPETRDELQLSADAARADYLRRFAAARMRLAKRLAAAGIAHATHVLDEAADLPLRRLFGTRR